MELFPTLELGWLNGWIFTATFYLIFGILLKILPQARAIRSIKNAKMAGGFTVNGLNSHRWEFGESQTNFSFDQSNHTTFICFFAEC